MSNILLVYWVLTNWMATGWIKEHKILSLRTCWKLNWQWGEGFSAGVVRDWWLFAHTHSGRVWAALGGHSDRFSAYYSALHKPVKKRRPRNGGWWGHFKKENGTICPPLSGYEGRHADYTAIRSFNLLSCRSLQHGGWRVTLQLHMLLETGMSMSTWHVTSWLLGLEFGLKM